MRVPKEIAVLLVLLAGVMIFVLWYVIDRKAKMRAESQARPASPATQTVTPSTAPSPNATAATPPAPPASDSVALGTATEKKTVDFSSGQPVVKNSAEDQAAMDTALKDMAAATDGVSFGPAPKKKAAGDSAAPATPPKS